MTPIYRYPVARKNLSFSRHSAGRGARVSRMRARFALGARPVLRAHAAARVLVVRQAPGLRPSPHPSPRNQPWFKRHPWFAQQLVPALQMRIGALVTR